MVDVRVRANDLFGGETMFGKPREDLLWIIPWIDDDRFAGLFIAENRAVALKPADGECFDDHFSSSAPTTFRVPVFAAPRLFASTLPMSFSSRGGSFCRTISLSRS